MYAGVNIYDTSGTLTADRCATRCDVTYKIPEIHQRPCGDAIKEVDVGSRVLRRGSSHFDALFRRDGGFCAGVVVVRVREGGRAKLTRGISGPRVLPRAAHSQKGQVPALVQMRHIDLNVPPLI